MGGESVVAERLLEVRDDIVDVLHADGEADGRGRNVLLRKLRGAELGVRGRVGMDDQGSEKILSRSMKRQASSCVPLISNVKMEAAPLGK